MINLYELNRFKKVYIQPHNYPDADALASSYGLHELLEMLGIESEVVCFTPRLSSTKPNLDKMIRNIEDSITFSKSFILDDIEDYALILIDVQKNNSNINCLNSKYIYCIDHHDEYSNGNYEDYDIRSSIGATSTLIGSYYKEYHKEPSTTVATLLSFGIHQDTGSLSEKTTNLDIDIKMWLNSFYNKELYDDFIHSSFTFSDMITLSSALRSTEQYRNVVFCKVNSNDDNMLGNISDTLSEISDIDIVITYAERDNGWKLSVRSYNKYLNAIDVVENITKNFSILGGGHSIKGGGFVLKKDFLDKYKNITFDIWLKSDVIYFINKWNNAIVLNNTVKVSNTILRNSKKVQKLSSPVRFLKIDPSIDTVKITTLTGVSYLNPKTHYLVIGVLGDLYPISISTFENIYEVSPTNLECRGDSYVIDLYKKDKYGIKISDIRYSLDEILNMPVAIPNDSIRRSYKLTSPCILKRGNSYLKGNPGDYVIMNSDGIPTHISKKEIYNSTFVEIN